jgi:hypothetical protein
MMKKVTELSLRDYIALDWTASYKPQLKRAVLELGNILAAGEAKRDGIPYTPLYWNHIEEGKWLYSLWELK